MNSWLWRKCLKPVLQSRWKWSCMSPAHSLGNNSALDRSFIFAAICMCNEAMYSCAHVLVIRAQSPTDIQCSSCSALRIDLLWFLYDFYFLHTILSLNELHVSFKVFIYVFGWCALLRCYSLGDSHWCICSLYFRSNDQKLRENNRYNVLINSLLLNKLPFLCNVFY